MTRERMPLTSEDVVREIREYGKAPILVTFGPEDTMGVPRIMWARDWRSSGPGERVQTIEFVDGSYLQRQTMGWCFYRPGAYPERARIDF